MSLKLDIINYPSQIAVLRFFSLSKMRKGLLRDFGSLILKMKVLLVRNLSNILKLANITTSLRVFMQYSQTITRFSPLCRFLELLIITLKVPLMKNAHNSCKLRKTSFMVVDFFIFANHNKILPPVRFLSH